MEININNNTYYFPEEISINILSRLPTMSVISCSLVCKPWRNLILYNRDFARTHLLRGLESHHGASCNGRLNFLLLTDLGYDERRLSYLGLRHLGYRLYYTLDDDYEKPELRLRVLSSNPKYKVVGSCNGLICMDYANDDRGFEHHVYICNPITREWLTLPSLTINECCCCSCSTNNNCHYDLKVVCGFGYLPSTDKYKVVRITYYRHHAQSRVGRVQVYTLGDGIGWRDKGQITYELENYGVPIALANGALHYWPEGVEEKKIVAFDLADEEFLFLPPPPFLIPYDFTEYSFQIQELGGQLCAFQRKAEDLTVGMWFFKNEKTKKNGNYKDGNGRQVDELWSWIKESDIELTDLVDGDFNLFILASDLVDGLFNPAILTMQDLIDGHFNPFILTKQGDVLYYIS